MRVAITGATGLIGGALVPALLADGHGVVVVSRRPAGAVRARFGERAAIHRVVRWVPARGEIDAAGLEGVDAAVHLAGESVMGLWTARKKTHIRASRVEGTRLLAETLASLGRPPATVVSASGINYYGARPADEPLDETAPPGHGFLAGVVRAWEAATAPAEAAGTRVVHTRFGLVLTPRGGVLRVMLPLFRLGLGGRVGPGDQAWSWVALDDVVGAILHALAPHAVGSPDDRGAALAGPVNVVSPNPVTQAEFVRTLARVLRRPAPFRVPAFAARLALREQADEMLLAGARVLPRRLEETGYRFRLAALEPALRHLLRRA